ncbi:MAG TPA: hypothetical protein DCE44_21005 [Verrucomicrobiales bacterium]|nr:hypothetical protein [Verrucomicrobiales bacterium]
MARKGTTIVVRPQPNHASLISILGAAIEDGRVLRAVEPGFQAATRAHAQVRRINSTRFAERFAVVARGGQINAARRLRITFGWRSFGCAVPYRPYQAFLVAGDGGPAIEVSGGAAKEISLSFEASSIIAEPAEEQRSAFVSFSFGH